VSVVRRIRSTRSSRARWSTVPLFDADLGYESRNMEGLSVHRGAAGEIVLTLVSDDNFSAFSARCYCSCIMAKF